MTNPFYSHTDGVPVAQSRGVSALLRTEFDLIQAGFDITSNYCVDSGVANAMVIAPVSTLVSLTDGLRFWIKAVAATTGATTVNMGATLGTVSLLRSDGSAITTDIKANDIFLCAYSTTYSALVTVGVTKNYIDQLIFTAALPGVAGNNGKSITLSGGSVAWGVSPVTGGGTGQSSYAIGDTLYASGATALSKLTAGTIAYAYTSGGPGVAPAWAILTAPGGGTGQASYTVGDILYASGTTTLSKLAASTIGFVPTSSGAGAVPVYADPMITAAAGGTVDAITATFAPALTLRDQQKCFVVSAGANTSATPTFAPNGLTAHTITMNGGQALRAGSIGPAGFVAIFEYNLANTRWELLNPVALGISSTTTITSNTTLTSATIGLHLVAMSSIGQSVTAPDATTLTVGGPRAIIDNSKGAYPAGFRDNTGVLIMAVAPGGVMYCELRDSSTAAGVWSVTGTNLEPGLITIDSTLSSTYAGTVLAPYVALDSNTSVHFVALASGFAAIVVDNAGKVLTTPVTVDATASSVPRTAFKVSSTTLIVFYGPSNASSSCVIISLTGSTPSFSLTVNTPQALGVTVASAAWQAEDFSSAPKIAQLSSTLYSFAGSSGTTLNVWAISVSGVAITIGTPTTGATISVASIAIYPLTATTALLLYKVGIAAPWANTAVVVSVSGTTSTINTPATLTGCASGSGGTSGSVSLSATKAIVLDDNNSTSLVAITVTVSSGTTVAAGTANTIAASVTTSGTLSYTLNGATRYNPLVWGTGTNSAAASFYDNTSSSASKAFTLSESAGVLTAGTISYNSINAASANSAGEGYMLPQGTASFLSVMASADVAASSPQNLRLVPSKISGSAITVGDSKPAPNLYPRASAVVGALLSSGDNCIFSSVNGIKTSPSMKVVRTNGDAINDRGDISLPPIGKASYPIPAPSSNRIVMLGTSTIGTTVGASTSQLRILNVEIAA